MRSFNRLSISQINTRGKRSDSERERTQAKGERDVFDTRKRTYIANDRAGRTSSSTRAQSQPSFAISARLSKKLVTLAAALLIATLILASVWAAFGIGVDIASAAGGVSETAHVGAGISEVNGSALAYSGVNSMVGTLISWNGDNGGYIQHPVTHMGSVWVIDNKGEMVNGANNERCPAINFYSKKNDNLSAIKLIAGHNATPSKGTTVLQTDLYNGETFNNIVNGTFNGTSGVNYFTVGGSGASASQISSDWAKAIFAASLYSNSGILNNPDFGGVKAANEYTFGWVSEFQTITAKVGGNADYLTKFGTPFNNNLLTYNENHNYNYIAIKLESDWIATDVSEVSDVEKNEVEEPIGLKAHIGRLSNAVRDNDPNGDTLIPIGTTFDANYNKHIMEDIDKGNVYLNSIYANGAIDVANSTDARLLSERIKAYANIYNREIRTQQLTFCPAGEGYSFGRLAIPDNTYVILDLNGHKIDRNLTNNQANIDTIFQSVFILGQYSRLEVFDSSVDSANPYGKGTVTGGVTKNGTGKVFDNQIWDHYGSDSNYANSVKGGGFTLRNRAELTVHSGNVTGNQGFFGGAFYGVGASTVNVFDAKVEGNSAQRGGMCYLSQGSFMTLNMFGGLAQGNSARMDGFAKKNSHDCDRWPSITDPTEETADGVYDKKYRKNPDGYPHEGGAICVYQEAYSNIYGGTITHNYSAMFGGGISVSYNSFLKLFGGEITGNVAKGLIRNINGAQIVSDNDPKQTETPKANVGGAGINMYQDSAGIYLNGPAKVMDNYCSQENPSAYTAEAIAKLIETDPAKEKSNLYLSLTVSMSRYTWESGNPGKYVDNVTKYGLVDSWDTEYAPKLLKTTDTTNNAVTRKGQMKFDATKHLYPEIKVQGSLYKDAQHVAQISITPAAGIEAGGYIMRQFYPKGWEDDSAKQSTGFDGTNGARPLKSGSLNETSHAKGQIGADGTTAFNLRSYLKTGATSGYVDGFLFTDGGTSIVAGSGNDEGWYLALGTKQAGNLPVEWQFYDSTVDLATNLAKGWTKAETNAETGTGFTLIYNGADRKYDIRVFVDRTKLTSGGSDLSGHYFLYYDYYTLADASGKENDLDVEGNPKKHYYYESVEARTKGEHTNILYITSGYDEHDEEIVQKNGVIYASERYDRLGYRFTIRDNVKSLTGPNDGTATPFNPQDQFIANPNYATMKIDRATLMISQLQLADIDRYYDGTKDFYIPSDTIREGTLTGQAPNDQSNLLLKFSDESNDYVHGKLQSPEVGTNTVSLGIIIDEIGRGEDHDNDHDDNTFPDKCLLANYMLYDLNTGTTYPAEERKEMSVTLNVNVQPKPIKLNFVPQTVEYGSIPLFGEGWVSIEDQPDCSVAYKTGIESLFDPEPAKKPGDVDFDPNALGTDEKFAKEDIEALDSSTNKALAAYQILGLGFTSTFAGNSGVGKYSYNLLYSNSNYAVTYVYNEVEYPAIQSGTTVTTVVLTDLFTVTPRNILLVVEDKSSVYGETLSEVNIKSYHHVVAEGDQWKVDSPDVAAIISGDSLQAEVNIKAQTSDYNTGSTTGALKKGTYDIRLTRDGALLNGNYSVKVILNEDATEGTSYSVGANTSDKAATYTVNPRRITLSVDELTSVYGDDLVADWQNRWSATATEGASLTGNAILNDDLAKFKTAVALSVSKFNGAAYTEEIKKAGEYEITLTYTATKDPICENYEVTSENGAYKVDKRAVTLTILSNQSSTYGEQIVLNTTGTAYWGATATTNGNSQKYGIIIDADQPLFESGIVLQFAYLSGDDWTANWDGILPSGKHVPAGQYAIIGTATAEIKANYDITWFGAWAESSNADSTYQRADLAGKAGCYTINKRPITVRPVTLSTEYGDKPIDFATLATVVDKLGAENGGVALDDGDKALIQAGFLPTAYWTANSSFTQAVLTGDALKIALATFSTNATKSSPVGIDYAIKTDASKYKADEADCDNANYDITFTDGTYTVSARKIKISSEAQYTIYGLLSDGNYAITFKAERVKTDLLYSDDDAHAFVESERRIGPTSEDGNAFTYTQNLSKTNGTLNVKGVNITLLGYQGSLNNGEYLSAGEHQLSVTTDATLANYDVNSAEMASTYVVLKRAIIVKIEDQSAEYSRQVPSINQQPDTDWGATGFNKESALYTEHGALAEQLTGTDYILEQDMKTASVWITLTSATLNANYGSYKIEGNCSNNNYDVKFVGSYGETVDEANDGTGGTFYITHIQIDAFFTGHDETKSSHKYELTYDRTSHKLGITLYALGGGSPSLPGDDEYTVVYSYKGFQGEFDNDLLTSGGTHVFQDAGTYTVTITLTGTAASNYQFGDGEDKDSLTLTFTIKTAEVSVRGLETMTFNRAIQLPNITFVNSQMGNDAVPKNDGETEWGVYYTPQNKWQTNPMPRQEQGTHFFGEPSYADVYNAYVMLLGDAKGNFKLTGAETGSVTLAGEQLKEGSVDVITANDAENPALKTLSGDELIFAEGCLISTTYTIDQLEILLIKSKTSNIFDDITHRNDALEVRMQSVGTDTALNDVPYKVVIYKDGEVFAVFHYGLAKDHNNHAHLGACNPDCDAAGDPPHHHLHFDFENKDGDNPTDSNNGHIVWTNNDTDVWADHDTIDAAFKNAGTFTLKLVLDNYNYKISDGKAADEGLAPAGGEGKEASLIQKDCNYAIEKAMLNPYLTKPTSNDAAESVRIQYDTQAHNLGVWFNCTNGFGEGLDKVLTLSTETLVGDGTGKYINNYSVKWSYTGWDTNIDSAAYKNVGTYTVTISLSDDSNFAFASGNEATLTFEIVAYELKKGEIAFTKGFKLSGDNIVLESGENYVYTGMSADPIATMFELRGSGATYKIAQQGKVLGEAKEFGYSVLPGGNGIDAGTHIYTVQGMRNFTGTIELTLVIDKKDLGNKYNAAESTWNEDGNNSSDIKETNIDALDKVYNGNAKTFDVKVEYTAKLPSETEYLNNLTGSDYTLKWFKKVGDDWKEVNNSDVKMLDAGDYRVVVIARDKDVAGGTGNYSGAYVKEFSISPSKVVLKPNVDVREGAIVFVYNGTQHVVGVTFNSSYATPGTHEYAVSAAVLAEKDNFSPEAQALISVNAGHYTITVTLTSPNFIWDEEQTNWTSFNEENSVDWTEESFANRAVHVKKGGGATTVTITYTINPATVEIESIESRLYNRGEQGDPETDPLKVNFKNSIDTNSKIPTSYDIKFAVSADKNQWLYQSYNELIEGSAEKEINAKLGGKNLPYYAGNYDATITLTGDDANNFRLVQKESYTTDLNIEKASEKEEGKTVDYSDKVASANGKSAVALFVIEALGVYANQTVSSVMFDNKDHFMGDPYGITEGGRYGGEGPWTISFSALSDITSVEGISYNITFENGKYLVIIKMGGYSHGLDVRTLAPDAIYLQVKGSDDKAKKINTSDDDDGIKAAFARIQELGLFTNAETYDYTLTFEFANFYFAGEIGGEELLPKKKPLKFTVNPATIALGTLANKTFNNAEQDADFTNDSFVAVGEAKFDESIYNILKGYNDLAAGSGFTFTYELPALLGNSKLGENDKPFNAGSYTVKVTLTSKNFRFSGEETESTMSFTIDPFDISTLKGDEQFVAELPDVRYTGMTMQTYIKQATLKIGGQTVTLVLLQDDVKDSAKLLGDDGYELTIARYNNNINVVRDTSASKTAQKKAEAFITGSGNFTGEIMQLFAILPREINVHINSIEENVYGMNLCVEIHVPANLGKLKGTDWTVGDENELSADEINDWITKSTPNAYGTSNQADIKAKLAQFETFQAKAFVYSGDDLAVSLSIKDGKYNDNKGATHSALLVGGYRIVGFHGNENYDVKFGGDYKTKMSSEQDDDSQYGYYQVVPREISITPADLGIVYGHATHEYAQNASQDGSQLYWTASANYGGEAILAADRAAVTAGITLEIADKAFTNAWLNVGTYKITVQWTATPDDDEIGNKVRACYNVKPAGTWVDTARYAISSASEAVTIGTGGTYTVTPREVTLTIESGVMKYEYDATSVGDMLAFMLRKFATTYAGENVEQHYGHIFTAANGTNIKDEATWYAEGDGFASLNIKLQKDEGSAVSHYSVTPSYENKNYTVTFDGTSNSVEITKRLIIVHINDQTQVYGDIESVGETAGKDNNWYAMLSEESTYWDAEKYGGPDKLNDRIAQGRLNSDDLGLNLQKELGANVGKYYIKGTYTNGNYDVTFEGSWTADQSTTDGTSGDPTDGTAGIYEITPRSVKVIIKGQSGVYGGNQLTAIGATENTHWNVVPAADEFKDVVNNDNLNIKITIIPADGKNEKTHQLNVGWYSVRVSYANANYTVTFESDNSNLNGAQYVKEYDSHSDSQVTEHRDGDAVTAYDVSNAYYIYARLISISVNPQSVSYTGEAPILNQDPSYWSANNVINGEMPAILEGDRDDFEHSIVLEFVAPTEGDDMYAVWKKWGRWSAGLYSGKSGIKATLKDDDGKLFGNYKLSDDESSILGTLRINPVEISVAHNLQSSVYNKKKPDIDQARTAYEITGKTLSSYRWNGSAFDEDATPDDNEDRAKNLLEFTFEYEGTDYGAGNHRITGRWTNDGHNPNYNVTFNPATYKIDKRELKVTINDLYVIYGEELWTGDEWWLDTRDDHGTQTPNPKYWSVEVTKANEGIDDGVCWMDEPDRQALGILPDSKAQQRAGTYQIAGSWNGSDDYNVTFVGSWEKKVDGDGLGGTYTVHKRAIIVHINDQGGVYGGSSFTSLVNQSMGTDANSGGWFVVGFDETAQKKICEGHECSVSGDPRLATDTLFITLSIEGDAINPKYYNIKGECRDENYQITWVGGNKGGDVSGYERGHGLFGIVKRQVTVNVNDQTIEYGKLKGGNTTGFDVSGYTARLTKDVSSSEAFVAADKVRVDLSVTVAHAGVGDYNQAGKYAIIVKIYETINGEEKLIYSSLRSEQSGLTTSEKYTITVTGNWEDKDFKSDGSVDGKTGAYIVTKKTLIITVADKSSVYGEARKTLTSNISGAMSDEEEHIKTLVKLAIKDPKYNIKDEANNYLLAGVYAITAKLDDSVVNNNYDVVFHTQNGVTYDEGADVTAKYTVTKRTLTVNITRISSVYGEVLTSFRHELSPVGILSGDLILAQDDDLNISFSILGAAKNYNLSTTNHLKAGIYPIQGTWNENENYAISFTGSWQSANTDRWLKQASENESLYENVHDVLDNRVGLYEVEKCGLTVTLGTEKPSSEYGDPITGLDTGDYYNHDRTWGVSYIGLVSAEEKQDNILFNMTTTARQGSDANDYPITIVERSDVGGDVGGDNANYNITFKDGTYTVKPREMTVTLTAKDPKIEGDFSCAVDVYGTTYDQEAKFTYEFTRTHPQGADNSFYNEETIDLVITPWKNALAQDAKLTETGFYPVGTYSLELSAKNDSNYSFTSMEGTNVRYKVEPRPLTIYVNEQSSVYGEEIVVHQGQGEGAEFGWHVVAGEIVQGNGATDDLGIRITKASGDKWAENGYMLTAEATNGSNYAITWQGNYFSDETRGTYTIQKRLILIRIHNQYSIYGENIKVSSETSAWEVVDPLTIADSHGKTYYTLIEGQTPGITLNIFTQETDGVKTWYVEGLLPRGEYRIGVQEISNNDYDVEIEDNYLPAVSDTEHRGYLKDEFSKDFGNPTSKDTIEVVNPTISKELANSPNATYFVTIRPVTIRINDQSGVYGDYLTLNQAEGALEAYNVELGANTTNTPFIGNYKATFDLVTTAFEGSDILGKNLVGVAAGWSLDATTYPIFGAAYHVFVDGVEKTGDEATKLSHNYQFNFEGAYTGEETYPSGTTFHGRAGVYTVVPRQVTLTANNSSEVYGGNSAITSFPYIPTLNQRGYNAIVNNSKTPQNDRGETHGAILDGDLAELNITLKLAYEEANLSAAKALKVGHYVINLTYAHNDNYDITAIDGDFEVMVRSAAIIIGQRATSATYLAQIPENWTNDNVDMYTRSNVLDGDVIVFTMSAAAEQGYEVGSDYELSGKIGADSEGDNKNYSIVFTSGTFEITRKQVKVKIIDQSSEYGNDIDVNVKSGWELPEDWNKNPGDGYTNNDNADNLGITLSTSATKVTGVGDYQIEGQYNLHGVGKNYDLQFVGSWNSSNEDRTDGDGGKLTIFARKLIVVIKPQAQEYRSSYALSPNEWFAWRDGHKATWNGEETVDEGGVLGGEDKLGDLRIELKRGGATDKAVYGENTNMDTYFGTYAIVGSSTASNYDIIFAYERAGNPDFNYADVKTNEDGVFNITAYKIKIKVLNLGMTDAAVQYGAHKFGETLTNAQGVIWEYADEGREFLPTELGYLSFSLGGDDIACDAYAFVGNHPIVGYWGKGLAESANDYRMQFNYEVTFEGKWSSDFNNPKDLGYESLYNDEGATAYSKCGIIQISPADITALNYEQEYQDGEDNGSHWHGNNWLREAVFSGNGLENPKHSMAVGAADFAFAGDVLFDGRAGKQFGGLENTVLQGKASVSYSNLTHNGAAVTWNDASVAPEEQAVGVWGVTVTVKAPYHNDATFTLTLDITRLDITIYLTTEKIHFAYGIYKLGDDGITSTDKSDFNEVLKKFLFGYNEAGENLYLDKEHEGGAIVGAEDLGELDDIMKYLLGSPEVKLSIATRLTDASSGGYLNVNSLGYALTIDAGENMSIHFGSEYYNVFIDARPLHADWRSTPKTDPQTSDDFDKVAYIYTFDSNEISVVPHVLRGDIMSGDSVLIDDDLGASIFDYALYKLQNGEYVAIGGKTVLDVGTYKALIRVNISPTSNNVDIGNYTTPEDWVYIVVRPRVITVVVENQSREYDEYSPTLDQHAWYIKTGDPSKDVTGGNHPTETPTGEPLSALGITLDFADKEVLNAGKYEIRATYTSVNYEIVFEGAFGAESGKMGTSGIFEITKREVRVRVNNFSFVYGNDIPDNLADDANGYTYIHLVNGEERPNEIAVLPRDSVSLNIAIDGVQRTQTGYIKAGEYNVKLSYSNPNYNIHFADSEGHPEGAGAFSVKVNVAKALVNVSIHGRQVRYGDLRPEMPENYTITGLASADHAFYEAKGLKRPEFINFIINNADTGTPLKEFDAGVREELMFDEVGVYIIQGSINELAEDYSDIGVNYEVAFSGEWAAYGRYLTEQYVGKASKYEVVPRDIGITIGNVESQYGDALTDEEIPFVLQQGANNKLAGDDKLEDLHVAFHTDAIRYVDGQRRTNKVGTYRIEEPVAGNKNYNILTYSVGHYEITPREIIIKVQDMTRPYGDDHAAHVDGFGYGNGWTAERYGDKLGAGVAYDDDHIKQEVKLGTEAGEHSAVGDYDLTVTTRPYDSNYSVKEIVNGKYTVAKRRVALDIDSQEGEYGDSHALGSHFNFTLLSTDSNKPTLAVVFTTDAINLLELFFTDEITARTPAGDYRIDASFTDGNYDVTVTGKYLDGDRQYGKYTVKPRDIVITLLGTQKSEYGDPVKASSEFGEGWTIGRPEGKGGNALVNDDTITLELAVLDELAMVVDSTYSVGKYAVIVKSAEISSNYNVIYKTQEGDAYEGDVYGHADDVKAIYTIFPRDITVEFGGESEYGDPVQVHDVSFRANGKEGEGIVNGDKLGFAWEWGAQGDPTNGGAKLADVGQYAVRLKDASDANAQNARKNYNITTSENSFYHVVPRKITVRVKDIVKTYGDAFEDPNEHREELLEVSRATQGATGDAILNNDIRFFSLNVVNGDNILLTDGKPVNAGVYNFKLVYTDNNKNYDISVVYGHYTLAPKPVTVNIDSKTSKYSDDIVALTYGEVKGLIGDDDLYISLSVLWLDEELGLEWHNAGVYAIKGVWDNPNYAVTFKGALGEFGAYTVEKADNMFTKEYGGNGTIYLGDGYRNGDLPTALWGNDGLRLEYYLDEAMTQKADFDDILDAVEGTYYVKAIVDEGANWTNAVTSFTVNVVNERGFSDGMDITAYVCVFASQFIILACALIFIRRKKEKNKKTNTSKAGN